MAKTHQATHQGSGKAYHHRHVISIMAPRPSSTWAPSSNRSSIMTPRHHQVISNKAPPSPSSKDQTIIKYINWTMGSTIKCNGSKPSARATSLTSIIKASISILWAPPYQTGSINISTLQGSMNIIYKHQYSCIML